MLIKNKEIYYMFEEIGKVYEEFADKITSIQQYQSIIKDNTRNELLALSKLEELPEDEDFYSVQRMLFPCAKTGKYVSYGKVKRTVTNQREALHFHKNKQYQWLLSEAYETYEDFLEKLYACAGYFDHSLWPMSDFGNISIKELQEKPLSWYFSKTKKINKKPNSILNQLRKEIEAISNDEENNKTDSNYKFIINLIANMRHIIVHKSGNIISKDDFIEKVMSESGLSLHGNNSERYLKTIDFYLANNSHKNLILLVEKKINTGMPIDSYYNRVAILISHLVAHAYLLKNNLLSHLEQRST